MCETEVMKTKSYILILSALVLFVGLITTQAYAESTQSKEYQVKAAFLYNFIKFVDWPKEKIVYRNDTIVMGIIGKDPFKKAFESVRNKKIKGKKLVVERFAAFEKIKDKDVLKKCHVLFICASEKEDLPEIIKALNDSPVLTVGETSGFLESGGIINFLMEEKKIRFEINLSASKKAKLKISSKLLRLAKRVIKEKDGAENADKQSINSKKSSGKTGE